MAQISRADGDDDDFFQFGVVSARGGVELTVSDSGCLHDLVSTDMFGNGLA